MSTQTTINKQVSAVCWSLGWPAGQHVMWQSGSLAVCLHNTALDYAVHRTPNGNKPSIHAFRVTVCWWCHFEATAWQARSVHLKFSNRNQRTADTAAAFSLLLLLLWMPTGAERVHADHISILDSTSQKRRCVCIPTQVQQADAANGKLDCLHVASACQ